MLCLHAAAGPASSPFQLYSQPARRNAIALAGHLDAASEVLFAATLHRILPLLSQATLEIDARELDFVGHRQLLLLDRCCATHDRVAVLHSSRPTVRRLFDLIGFEHIHIDTGGGVRPEADVRVGTQGR
ncbi:MAG: hypothetical protein WBH51_05345 [Mycolicibacter algericus]|uniref:STAS domain-containing protein n=1 Tax=Mycolicibacter algericus TaxID=1288388 RepID=UPI003C737F23